MTMKAIRRIARTKLIGILAAFALLAAFLPIGDQAQADELDRKMTIGSGPLFGVPDEPDVDGPKDGRLPPEGEDSLVLARIRIGIPVVFLPGQTLMLQVNLSFSSFAGLIHPETR